MLHALRAAKAGTKQVYGKKFIRRGKFILIGRYFFS
jgi:hypothetical protein